MMNCLFLTACSAVSSVATSSAASTATNIDANSIAHSAGECLMSAIHFLTNPGNFSIAIGVALIYLVICLFTRGAGRLFESLMQAVVAIFVVYVLLGAFGINVDLNGIWAQVKDTVMGFLSGISGKA